MKIIKNAMVVASVLLILWIVVSYIDITAHNSPFISGYRDYADWNFFTIFFGLGGE